MVCRAVRVFLGAAVPTPLNQDRRTHTAHYFSRIRRAKRSTGTSYEVEGRSRGISQDQEGRTDGEGNHKENHGGPRCMLPDHKGEEQAPRRTEGGVCVVCVCFVFILTVTVPISTHLPDSFDRVALFVMVTDYVVPKQREHKNTGNPYLKQGEKPDK